MAIVCSVTLSMVMDKPPNSLIFGMGPSNPPRNVTLHKKLESVAIAPQLLRASKLPASATRHEHLERVAVRPLSHKWFVKAAALTGLLSSFDRCNERALRAINSPARFAYSAG